MDETIGVEALSTKNIDPIGKHVGHDIGYDSSGCWCSDLIGNDAQLPTFPRAKSDRTQKICSNSRIDPGSADDEKTTAGGAYRVLAGELTRQAIQYAANCIRLREVDHRSICGNSRAEVSQT